MKKGFNFVELLMVMLILGVIITLTMPLIKNIKDDEDIYRSYMKKANQDVTDAITMALMKERYLTDLNMLGRLNGLNVPHSSSYSCDATGIRNLFNLSINAKKCGNCHDDDCRNEVYQQTCMTKDFPIDPDGILPGSLSLTENAGNNPGLILGSKAVILFDAVANQPAGGVCTPNADDIYGFAYVDMNGDKSPNQYCKDRYKFIIYNDRVAMDGCGLEL